MGGQAHPTKHSEYPSILSAKNEVAPTGALSSFLNFLKLVGSSGELPIEQKKRRGDVVVVFRSVRVDR